MDALPKPDCSAQSPENSRPASAMPSLHRPKPAGGAVGGLGLGLAKGTRPRTARPSPRAPSEDTSGALKRGRPASGNDLARLDDPIAAQLSAPLVPLSAPGASAPETMALFFARVKAACVQESREAAVQVRYAVWATMRDGPDGLYIHKRPVRGLGPNNPLAIGGTVFHHVLLYIKRGDKLQCLDYGPDNMDDVTSNFMEHVDARPVLMNEGAGVTVPEGDTLPFLHIQTPLHSLAEQALTEAFDFCNARKYHVIHNNCIQNADFLARVITGGIVKNAPLIYDAMCGDVPPVDPPMLMMLPLLLQKTWQQVCDGSQMMAEYLQQHSITPIVLTQHDMVQFAGVPLKRQEAEAGCSRKQPPAVNTASMPPTPSVTSSAAHEPDDLKQYNNANFWGRPYLDCLHIVEDNL